MSTEKPLCSICSNCTAEWFCACTNPEPFLCVNCTSPHAVQGKASHTLPCLLASWPTTESQEERAQTRAELFPQVTLLMRQQVAMEDQAIEEFTTGIERALWEIIEYSNKTVNELKELKAKLSRETEAGLAEVETTIEEDQPHLTSHPHMELLFDYLQNNRRHSSCFPTVSKLLLLKQW